MSFWPVWAAEYSISFIMLFMDKFNEPARIGVFIGPILVSIGALMLFLDLGLPARAFRLFTTLDMDDFMAR